MNPCFLKNPCAVNAECYPSNHKAQCRCPPGLEGNPLIKCETSGCKSDSECPLDKACVDRQCVNPCLYNNDCAPNADCFVLTHRPQCRCPSGFLGNPREYCRRPEPEAQPECFTDPDCPRGLACIDSSCRNPCSTLNPCHPSAQCQVIDTSPIKTMICICPSGTIGDGYSQCGELTSEAEGLCPNHILLHSETVYSYNLFTNVAWLVMAHLCMLLKL